MHGALSEYLTTLWLMGRVFRNLFYILAIILVVQFFLWRLRK